MNFSFNTWIGQVTTGHGVMVIGPTLLAVMAGTMTWQTAVPLVVAGLVGLLWPENAPLKTATQTVASDLETLIAAYRARISPTPTGGGSVPTTLPDPSTAQPRAGTGGSLAAFALAVGLSLAACANQSPAQQATTGHAIASGVLCLANAAGKVVGTATTHDPDALKAVNAAVATGSVLLTDAACQTALGEAVAAPPTNVTNAP